MKQIKRCSVLLVVCLIVLCAGCSSGSGYDQIATEFMKCCINADGNALAKLHSDSYLDAIVESNFDNKDDFVNYYTESFQEVPEYLDFWLEEGWSYSISVTESYEYQGDDLDAFNETYQIETWEGKNAQDAYSITVVADVVSKDKESSEQLEATLKVYKLGGKWYLADWDYYGAVY